MRIKDKGLKIVEPQRPADTALANNSEEKKSAIEVSVSPAEYRKALAGNSFSNPFSSTTVKLLPEWMLCGLDEMCETLKPPKEDLYAVLCKNDPDLAKEIGPADLALMDKMLKNV